MDFDEESSRPNKSALKRAAREVENVAEQLAEAAETALAGLDLSQAVQQELDLLRRVKGKGARKRQLKHMAGLLRGRPEELAVIREHLEGESDRHAAEQRLFHHVEAWRDRLCAAATAEAALEELAGRCPNLDPRELARLSRAACHGDKAAARQIFRRLREVADALS